ncbi:hypothetical protein PDL71_08900 [Lacibacter sp. MH-610]|uniref:hypothetical protein n=1 Tax=Lacibacter sp. MH-610 TaxID=3020883 RepID=UPI0038921B2A
MIQVFVQPYYSMIVPWGVKVKNWQRGTVIELMSIGLLGAPVFDFGSCYWVLLLYLGLSSSKTVSTISPARLQCPQNKSGHLRLSGAAREQMKHDSTITLRLRCFAPLPARMEQAGVIWFSRL